MLTTLVDKRKDSFVLAISVRRRRSALHPAVDALLPAKSASSLREQLRRVLKEAQARRGVDGWSDDDPEVWVGSMLVGRLPRNGDVDELVEVALGQYEAELTLARYKKLPLTPRGISEQPGRDQGGVIMLFRRAAKGETPDSQGFVCLLVLAVNLVEAALGEALRDRPTTGATYFAVDVNGLAIVNDDVHRRLYASLRPLLGVKPDDDGAA